MPDFSSAIVRRPGEELRRALSTAGLGPPDPPAAQKQHEDYVAALERLGLSVACLPPLEAYPDSVFVEDTAVFMDPAVVVCRPGAPTRMGEAEVMRGELQKLGRPMMEIRDPGTLDGGDVLRSGNDFFVGLSSRTNGDGFSQFAAAARGYGYSAHAVNVAGGLHLKSGVSLVAENTLLLAPFLADEPAFQAFERLVTPPGEEYAANCLAVNGALLVPGGFPRTAEMLRARGLPVQTLDMTEFRRADGGLSCLSLRF